VGGTALDLAAGRHALFLAQRKWRVTAVDISDVAIRTIEQKARQLGVSLEMFAMNAKDYPFASDQLDLIIMFYHFDSGIVPRALSALRPGGLMLCKGSLILRDYEGTAPSNLQPFKSGEILDSLPGMRVLHHQERPVRDREVVEYVGQKC
jgi:cyclopropane fatty-acyl-phospholipid synthase-like methyltransferase